MPDFKVIDGTPPPDTPKERVRRRIRAVAPPHMFSCHRCGGLETIETKIGMTFKNGRPSGGTKTWLCALCFMRGERVVLK